METASDASEITMSGTVDREAGSYQFDMSGVAGLEELGGGSAVSFVVIGPDAWISTGDGNYIKAPGGAAMFGSLEQALAPGTLLGSIPTELAPEPAGGRPGGEERRRHDPLPRDGCGLAPGGPGSRARLGRRRVDRRRRRVHRLDGDGAASSRVNGTDTPVTMSIDISRINDESIAIEDTELDEGLLAGSRHASRPQGAARTVRLLLDSGTARCHHRSSLSRPAT